jgi:hypothetical protein
MLRCTGCLKTINVIQYFVSFLLLIFKIKDCTRKYSTKKKRYSQKDAWGWKDGVL